MKTCLREHALSSALNKGETVYGHVIKYGTMMCAGKKVKLPFNSVHVKKGGERLNSRVR